MTAALADTCRSLAASLAGLKQRARDAVAAELAAALGSAAKNLAAAVFSAPPPRPVSDWRHHGDDGGRGDWGDPWDDDPGDDRRDVSTRYGQDAERSSSLAPQSGAPGAVAVGLALGRWWLGRRGGVLGALGVGALAAALGLAGGPLARAALAVLAAAADLLAAESALGRAD